LKPPVPLDFIVVIAPQEQVEFKVQVQQLIIRVPQSPRPHRDDWEGKNLNTAKNKTGSPQAARRSLTTDN
jgi:hypothetical protein